jgi:hypothetical protein
MVTGSGGDKRDRTADLLNAIQALSQLSYTPEQEELYHGENRIVNPHFALFCKKKNRRAKSGKRRKTD